ncbi:MAG: ShlB/FhaC/HecB family hemolysin secretion/activation protein [Magnetococcales bacterium]|nr:ShlB/FhaC/HecB family hemolysin secretion/activation protein [Magnetococcales bacterium]
MIRPYIKPLSTALLLGLLVADPIWAEQEGGTTDQEVATSSGKRRVRRGMVRSVESSDVDTTIRAPEYPRLGETPAPGPAVLPSLPQSGPDHSLSAVNRLMLRSVLITGNQVLSDDEAQALVAPWLNRELTMEELLQLKDAVTQWYIERGYVTSGATLPDQQVSDGIVRLQVVEGLLGDVTVQGNKQLRASYITERLQPSARQVVNIHDMEQQFQILRQKEMIEQVHAELRPGLTAGEAIMDVRVEERRPWQLLFGYNNQGSPNMGAQRLSVGALHRSVLGWGDHLEGEVIHSRGEDNYAFSYNLPLVWFGLPDSSFFVKSGHTGSSVIVAPFDGIGVSGRSRTHAVGLRHALWKTMLDEVAVSVSLQRRQSQTFLSGAPYQYTQSDSDARTVVNTLNFGQEWHHRDQNQVLALLSTFSKGLNLNGTTQLPNEPDGRFLAWLGQIQWARRLPFLESQLITRLAYRWTTDPMLATEKFTLGGVDTVRGYREGLISRDQGVLANLEWRVPTPLKVPLPLVSDPNSDGTISLALFSDVGKNWDRKQTHTELPRLASVGVGLLWEINRDSSVAIYLAEALNNVRHSNEDLQDRGVHFRVTLAPF